jgi:murein DD-endopeptidase MepM/ murein hydrolase activator NlpD
LEPVDHWLRRAAALPREHRRALVTTAVAGLVGFSAVAFGIAPLAPDAADLPRRLVTEVVEPVGLAEQLDALASQQYELTRADLTRASDTAESLLARLGVVDDSAADFLRHDAVARKLLAGAAGKMVQIQSDEGGRLRQLVARYPAENKDRMRESFTRLTVARDGSGWTARAEEAALERQVRLAGGTIRSSLFAATDEARVPDAIASQLAEIFSNDIDFRRDLREGDSFAVVYESLTADGEPITWNDGTGRVLAAEFANHGKEYEAAWFETAPGKGGYFALDGTSKRRTFLSSPLAFSRVTSGFSMRFHPILKTWRQHKGIDFAAPSGTPIRSVGDGVVAFAGWQNGYGNAVEIRHGNGRSTFYAHMSRRLVNKGEHVTQGETIGLVGRTGWATGPHVHFEFRVGGGVRDPRLIAKASETLTLPADLKPAFLARAATFKSQLAIAESLLTATSEAE